MSDNNVRPLRPILIAIGGDSGTGKATLTRGLTDILGSDNVLNICLDDYHVVDREGRQREGVTPLNPVANNIPLMEEHVLSLRAGTTIVKPVYNHATGTFDDPEVVLPKPIIIVRGLFPLLTERLRNAFDMRVWLEPEDDLKYHWKLQRDVAERGYMVEEVIRAIVHSQDDMRQFILPQIRHADVIVRFATPPGYFQRRREGATDDGLAVKLIQRSDLKVDIDSVLEDDDRVDDSFRVYDGYYRDKPAVVIEISGDIKSELAHRIEGRLWKLVESQKDLGQSTVGRFLENGTTSTRSHALALAEIMLATRVAVIRERLTSTRNLESVG